MSVVFMDEKRRKMNRAGFRRFGSCFLKRSSRQPPAMDPRISQLPFDLRLSIFDFMPIYGFAHATSIIR
jgi:hypothetical protein